MLISFNYLCLDLDLILYLVHLQDLQLVATFAKPGGDSPAHLPFSGKDGSRAYSTGQFDEAGLTDDVLDLKSEQIGEVYNWLNVFGKKYPLLGRLEVRMGILKESI